MAKTKIQVSPNGQVKILDICGLGANCIESSKGIEAAFGVAQESSRVITDQYYEEVLPPIELDQEQDG